jgi:V/A-type H+-transporting ATPase subunit I
MIAKMKEIWLFTLSSSVDDTLLELGKLGVIEIKEIQPFAGEQLERNTKKITAVNAAIAILENYTQNNHDDPQRKRYKSVDPARVTDRVAVAVDYRKKCQTRLQYLQQQLNWYQTWGEHTKLKDLKYLQKKGIHIRLYLVDKKRIDTLPEDQYIIPFTEQGGKIPIALISRSDTQKLKLEEVPWPTLSLAQIRKQISRKERQLEEVELYLYDQAGELPLLHDYKGYLQDILNTQKAFEGMGDIEGSIKYLRGFLPKDEVELFKRKAKEKKWGYQISEPSNPEEVPVYVKNPKWVSIINPVMKFIDIVPGYKEVDVSIYFLVAFALFFAMLVGDAGYGALFLILAFLFRKKLSAQLRLLIYVLSGSTIIWGVLSGTYFGSEQIAAIPFLNRLIVPEVASFGVDNISFMMHLSFLIGAIHLTIAHTIKVVMYSNSVRALSEVGWIAFVWGLFFVVEQLVIGKSMPDWSIWLFVVGTVLVALFSKASKGFFNSMLASLANLPLSLINGFSDIVSYVRLFAVGMATAMVASSFNNMVLPLGVDASFLDMVMAVIALLLGHTMNIVLALMAVMVHGIRLNMLEFAGHLGVQFSGETYQPFKLNNNYKNNKTNSVLLDDQNETL